MAIDDAVQHDIQDCWIILTAVLWFYCWLALFAIYGRLWCGFGECSFGECSFGERRVLKNHRLYRTPHGTFHRCWLLKTSIGAQPPFPFLPSFHHLASLFYLPPFPFLPLFRFFNLFLLVATQPLHLVKKHQLIVHYALSNDPKMNISRCP